MVRAWKSPKMARGGVSKNPSSTGDTSRAIMRKIHAGGVTVAATVLHASKPTRISASDLQRLLEKLTGQSLPIEDSQGLLEQVAERVSDGQSIGYSQFNELLMYMGYDRVSPEFFQYLCSPEVFGAPARHLKQISSVATLNDGIDRFRKLALLLYGNVKYGFKTLSRDPSSLLYFSGEVHAEKPDDSFRARHDPLVALKKVNGDETFLLGYISGQSLESRLNVDPQNADLLAERAHRLEVIERGKWNHNVYLTSDHLDVYIATSMREPHEYVFVSDFVARMETNPHVKDLKLRLFDPTQAYCPNRIDKGLAEALMLKRAACTIYLAQESDTFGKDSELASTLAQGKPVIAFVPEVTEDLWKEFYDTFRRTYPQEADDQTLTRILKIYKPNSAWEDDVVKNHLSCKDFLHASELEEMAKKAVMDHYDKRARVLKETHPLGLQTNLSTGVANGVLVARTVENCAILVRKILLNNLGFDIEDLQDGYVHLRETTTGCIFRVMTADRLLSNSFWNFYVVD